MWAAYQILGLLVLSVFLLGNTDFQFIEDQPTTLVYPSFWHTPFGLHRATPELLAFFVGERTFFHQPQGLACHRLLSKIQQPQDECEFQVTVIGINNRGPCLIYNPSLTSVEVLGDRQSHPGLFRQPQGVALNAEGTAYATDPGWPRVLRLQQQPDNRLAPAGVLPPPPQGWQQPWGIALDSQGQIYISDSGCQQIFVYSPQGELLHTIGPKLSSGYQLSAPQALAVVDSQEPWSYYHDNFIFVCDQAGSRLLRLDLTGQVQKVFFSHALAAAAGKAEMTWMALDFYENLWVTDRQQGQLHKFNRHLVHLASVGPPGQGDHAFQQPAGIAIFRHFGQVFVAEATGAQYFWIGADVLQAKAVWETNLPTGVQLEFFLTEPAWISLSVSTPPASTTQVIYQKYLLDSGPQKLFWPCPLALSDQPLTLTLTTEATYSSAQRMAKRIYLKLAPLKQPPLDPAKSEVRKE